MAPFNHQLRVRFNECDPQRVAFNANYFAWIDIALTELWRQSFGQSYDVVMASNGVDIVVAEATLKFLAPARFDDEIEIAITVERIGTTSLQCSSMISHERQPLVTAELRYVFVELEQWTKTPIPDPIRERLAQYGPAAG